MEITGNIEESSESNIFEKYVEIPFQDFCEDIAKGLPAYFSLHSIKKGKDYSHILCNHPSYLRAFFTTSQLLYIEITASGIKRFIHKKTYYTMIKEASKNHPKYLAEMLYRSPSFFSSLSESICMFSKKEILEDFEYINLIEILQEDFKKYLPLIILATCDNPMPVIHYFSNLENSINLYDLYDWDETGFTDKELQCWLRAINRKKQAIIYGSPGTGKTFIAQKLAEKLVGKYGFIELVQFHPAYTYEDFIQGIRPQSEDGKLTYPVVPGRFLEFCKKAEVLQDICVLIIDEINRANLAQVFGELMYLLEYRNQEIPLAGGNRFRIPENVRIIGTMNTADRSIAQIDHALRRRFAFIELRPNYDVLIKYHLNTNFDVMDLINVLKQLNQAINDKNYEIGISFFLTPNLREDIEDIWKMEIEPYLDEYFFNNLEKVDEFRWDKIEKQITI